MSSAWLRATLSPQPTDSLEVLQRKEQLISVLLQVGHGLASPYLLFD